MNNLYKLFELSKENFWLEACFLVAILGLLFFAMWQLAKCSKRWNDILAQFKQSKFKTASFSLPSVKVLLTQSTVDTFLLSVPGTLVLIGLLGTFMNLGLAIIQMADDDVTLATLAPLGSKFKISIWGILANLMYRACLYHIYGNVMRGIMYKFREEVEKEEEVKQNNIVQKELKEHTERENRYKVELQYRKDMLTALAVLGPIKTATESQLGLQGRTNSELSYLNTQFSTFNQSINRLENAADTMKNAGETASKSLKDTTEKFAVQTKNFTDAVIAFQSKTELTLNKLDESIKGFNETVKKSFGDFSINVVSTLNGIRDELKQVMGDLKGAVVSSTNEMNHKVGEMTKQIEAIRGITRAMTDINGELTNEMREIRKHLVDSHAQFEKAADFIARTNRQMKSYFEKDGVMDSLMKELLRTIVDIRNNPPSMQETNTALDDLKNSIEGMSKILLSIDGDTKAVKKSLLENKALLSLTPSIDNISKNLSSINNSTADFKNSITKLQQSLKQPIEVSVSKKW